MDTRRTMSWLSRLIRDDQGAVLSVELMMIGTVLVIGVLVGLKSVRDAVVTELADVAQAMSNANQSFLLRNQNSGWNNSGWNSNQSGSDSSGSSSNSCINVCAQAVAESNS